MADAWVTLLTALGGALIGALGPVVTIVISNRAERHRERLRLVVQLAQQDRDRDIEHKKIHNGIVYPISTYVHYHMRMLDLLERGQLTPAALQELDKEQQHLCHAIRSAQQRPKPTVTS
jgi:hypothetical protein